MLKIYYSGKTFRFGVLLAAISLLLLSSCASTSPDNAKFTETLSKEQYLDANDTASVKVEVNNNVIIEEHEKQRLARVLIKEINEQKIHNVDSADKREFELYVFMTRYDKGNAFARAMLAGLGQIHIDAKVSMFLLPERKKIAEFDIDKTFAWGGLYGGFTSIESVEEGFAKGVAEAVTNIKDE